MIKSVGVANALNLAGQIENLVAARSAGIA